MWGQMGMEAGEWARRGREAGESGLCMTSSLTTGLEGSRFASHGTPVPPSAPPPHPDFTGTHLSAINAEMEPVAVSG